MTCKRWSPRSALDRFSGRVAAARSVSRAQASAIAYNSCRIIGCWCTHNAACTWCVPAGACCVNSAIGTYPDLCMFVITHVAQTACSGSHAICAAVTVGARVARGGSFTAEDRGRQPALGPADARAVRTERLGGDAKDALRGASPHARSSVAAVARRRASLPSARHQARAQTAAAPLSGPAWGTAASGRPGR